MSNPGCELSDLAAAVADGQTVDWDAVEMAAATPLEHRAIRRLRRVARIAEVYRSASDSQSRDDREQSVVGSFGLLEPAPLVPLQPGTRWGTLEIVQPLGRGTFGDVYRARDHKLDRDVALKLLRNTERSSMVDVPTEFVHEGRLLARVRHPNVVAVFGADRIDQRVGVWMELIEGCTLEDEARERGVFSAEATADIGVDVCRALAAVHAAGQVHRDVKAHNVMRDRRDGRIVLMDFSAGRELEDRRAADDPLPVSLAGSPIYLAPEVLAGRPATRRSDIYSLGVLLFRLASGRFPVEGPTLQKIRQNHTAGVRTRLAEVGPELSPAFVDVVERAIDPDPAARFESATEMGQALSAAVHVGAPSHWRRRTAWLIGLAASVVIAVATLVHPFGDGGSVAAPRLSTPHDMVLVSRFENASGHREDAGLIERSLESELRSTDFVTTASPERVGGVLALMRQPPDSRLDARLARDVILRDGGIRALVTGRIQKSGAGVLLTSEIVAPRTGALMASVTDTLKGPPDPGEASRHARRVRVALQDVVQSIEVPDGSLEKVTTTSLKALQLYSQAAALVRQAVASPRSSRNQEFEAVKVLLRQAVIADPSFASAWWLLAQAIYGSNPRTSSFLTSMDQAVSLASGVSERERYRILGWSHLRRAEATGDRRELEQAALMYEAQLRLDPAATWVEVRNMGMYVGRRADASSVLHAVYRQLGRTADADRLTFDAAARNANSTSLTVEVARIELRRGNFDRSRALAMRAVSVAESDPADKKVYDVGWARLWEAHYAWLRNDAPGALAAVRAAVQRWPLAEGRQRVDTEWEWLLANVYVGLGRFREAEAVIDSFDASPNRKFDLAVLALREGKRDLGRALLDPLLVTFEGANRAVGAILWAGLIDKADWAVEERRRRGEGPPWLLRTLDEAQLRVAQGRHAEGVALLLPLMAIDPNTYDTAVIHIRARENVAIGKRALGDLAGAIQALEPLGASRAAAVSYHWGVDDWLRCRVLLAELYREAGRPADAERIAAGVRTLLAAADPGHPLLARMAHHTGSGSTVVNGR